MEINLMYLRTFRIFDNRNRILEQNIGTECCYVRPGIFQTKRVGVWALLNTLNVLVENIFYFYTSGETRKNFRLFVEVNIHLEGTFHLC